MQLSNYRNKKCGFGVNIPAAKANESQATLELHKLSLAT